MKLKIVTLVTLAFTMVLNAQDWKNYPIPANPGQGKVWQLQTNQSDEFNYTYSHLSILFYI